jgi:hypothetical protein
VLCDNKRRTRKGLNCGASESHQKYSHVRWNGGNGAGKLSALGAPSEISLNDFGIRLSVFENRIKDFEQI